MVATRKIYVNKHNTGITFWFQMNIVIQAHLCTVYQLSHDYGKAKDVSFLGPIERVVDISQKLRSSIVHLFINWILQWDHFVFGTVFELPQAKAREFDLQPAVHKTRTGPQISMRLQTALMYVLHALQRKCHNKKNLSFGPVCFQIKNFLVDMQTRNLDNIMQ